MNVHSLPVFLIQYLGVVKEMNERSFIALKKRIKRGASPPGAPGSDARPNKTASPAPIYYGNIKLGGFILKGVLG